MILTKPDKNVEQHALDLTETEHAAEHQVVTR